MAPSLSWCIRRGRSSKWRANAYPGRAKVCGTVRAWRGDSEVETSYEDVSGFCYSAKFEEIEKNNFVLTPGRYVGTEEQEEDGEPFEGKMRRLTAPLKQQQEGGAKLDQQIAENLRRIGYELLA